MCEEIRITNAIGEYDSFENEPIEIKSNNLTRKDLKKIDKNIIFKKGFSIQTISIISKDVLDFTATENTSVEEILEKFPDEFEIMGAEICKE